MLSKQFLKSTVVGQWLKQCDSVVPPWKRDKCQQCCTGASFNANSQPSPVRWYSSSANDPKQETGRATNTNMVRLSKRLSELDLCSRRQADRFILEGKVQVRGRVVEPVLGQKVDANESEIALIHGDSTRKPRQFSWADLRTAAVVLHKPSGYVTGLYDDTRDNQNGYRNNNKNNKPNTSSKQHIPAVRLLTQENAYIRKSNYYKENSNEFLKREYKEAQQIVQNHLPFRLHRPTSTTTLDHYIPAGRLDLNSSGLLVFSQRGGVFAKKLVAPNCPVEKEYMVLVEPIQQAQRYAIDGKLPPKHHKNLSRFRRGGHRLWGEEYKPPLRPLVRAEWIRWEDQAYIGQGDWEPNQRRRILSLTLKEGRKHQIRRMCQEILGMHVVQLIRVRVGPIHMSSLPEPGTWRPLREDEAHELYHS